MLIELELEFVSVACTEEVELSLDVVEVLVLESVDEVSVVEVLASVVEVSVVEVLASVAEVLASVAVEVSLVVGLVVVASDVVDDGRIVLVSTDDKVVVEMLVLVITESKMLWTVLVIVSVPLVVVSVDSEVDRLVLSISVVPVLVERMVLVRVEVELGAAIVSIDCITTMSVRSSQLRGNRNIHKIRIERQERQHTTKLSSKGLVVFYPPRAYDSSLRVRPLPFP